MAQVHLEWNETIVTDASADLAGCCTLGEAAMLCSSILHLHGDACRNAAGRGADCSQSGGCHWHELGAGHLR